LRKYQRLSSVNSSPTISGWPRPDKSLHACQLPSRRARNSAAEPMRLMTPFGSAVQPAAPRHCPVGGSVVVVVGVVVVGGPQAGSVVVGTVSGGLVVTPLQMGDEPVRHSDNTSRLQNRRR